MLSEALYVYIKVEATYTKRVLMTPQCFSFTAASQHQYFFAGSHCQPKCFASTLLFQSNVLKTQTSKSERILQNGVSSLLVPVVLTIVATGWTTATRSFGLTFVLQRHQKNHIIPASGLVVVVSGKNKMENNF